MRLRTRWERWAADRGAFWLMRTGGCSASSRPREGRARGTPPTFEHAPFRLFIDGCFERRRLLRRAKRGDSDLRVTIQPESGRLIAHLRYLYVPESHQHPGVGGVLIGALEQL